MKRVGREWVRVERQVVNKEQQGREGVIHCWVPFPAERACLFRFQFKEMGGSEHGGWEGAAFREQHINSAHSL